MHTVAQKTAKAGLVAILFLTLSPSLALGRPSIPANSCAKLKAIVQANGTIVLDLKPGVYRRFVAHGGFCRQGGREQWKIVQASDGKCYLRICKQVASPLGR